jgi:hypothetical protein
MKLVLHFAVGCLILAYIVVITFLYLLFWPVPTLELTGVSKSGVIPIINTVVHPGDTLRYTLSYCKYTDKQSTVHRSFVDGQVIILTDTVGKFPKGCRTATVATGVVPETINPGRYYMDVTVEYNINPFRQEFVHYKTSYFEVTAK